MGKNKDTRVCHVCCLHHNTGALAPHFKEVLLQPHAEYIDLPVTAIPGPVTTTNDAPPSRPGPCPCSLSLLASPCDEADPAAPSVFTPGRLQPGRCPRCHRQAGTFFLSLSACRFRNEGPHSLLHTISCRYMFVSSKSERSLRGPVVARMGEGGGGVYHKVAEPAANRR